MQWTKSSASHKNIYIKCVVHLDLLAYSPIEQQICKKKEEEKNSNVLYILTNGMSVSNSKCRWNHNANSIIKLNVNSSDLVLSLKEIKWLITAHLICWFHSFIVYRTLWCDRLVWRLTTYCDVYYGKCGIQEWKQTSTQTNKMKM